MYTKEADPPDVNIGQTPKLPAKGLSTTAVQSNNINTSSIKPSADDPTSNRGGVLRLKSIAFT